MWYAWFIGKHHKIYWNNPAIVLFAKTNAFVYFFILRERACFTGILACKVLPTRFSYYRAILRKIVVYWLSSSVCHRYENRHLKGINVDKYCRNFSPKLGYTSLVELLQEILLLWICLNINGTLQSRRPTPCPTRLLKGKKIL